MKFVENFCALAYFRIPEFREKLLTCIKSENDREISEWRGTDYKLEDEPKTRFICVGSFFDWNYSFYLFLKKESKYEVHYNLL